MKNKTNIVNTSVFNKAKQEIAEIKKLKKTPIIIGKSNLFNRKILEKEKDVILLLNFAGKKDRFKQRESGLNHVLVNFAKKNNHKIGINLDEILGVELKGEKLAQILSRIKQNIRFANKKKLEMKFISLEGKKPNKIDLRAFGLSLGMPTWMAKGAVEN